MRDLVPRVWLIVTICTPYELAQSWFLSQSLFALGMTSGGVTLMAISQIADELRRSAKKDSHVLGRLLRRLLRFLVEVLSSPKGNQGGWEGGARGL